MLNCEKSAMLRDICDIFKMNNIVQKATCFTKIANATLLDLILTYQGCDFRKVCNLVLVLVMCIILLRFN